MRYLAGLLLLAVSARCQENLIIYSSDISGHYVPYNGSFYDCPLVSTLPKRSVPVTMQLEREDEVLVEEDDFAEASSPWGECGVGGVPR